MAAESRQVRRRKALIAEKRASRPGPRPRPLTPKTGRPERMNRHILWTIKRGATEFYFHATKGPRHRYVGA